MTDIFMAVKTSPRFKEIIWVNISDEACIKFGFLHRDIIIDPDNIEATIMGVALDNNGEYVLWYLINWEKVNAPNGKGGACYWGGTKFLPDAGFRKLNQNN